MKTFLLLLLLISACQLTKSDLCTTRKEVLAVYFSDIFNDPVYKITGTILAYPGQQKTDDKPMALRLEIVSKQRKEIADFIKSDFKSAATFDSCMSNAADILAASGMHENIKSDPAVYRDSSVHMLGTLTLIGVYVSSDSKGRPAKCFLDILRREGLKSKSQFNDIVEFTLKNGKWVKTDSKNYEMS